MVQWCPLPGGGASGGLVLHCCFCGVGLRAKTADKAGGGYTYGAKVISSANSPTNTTGGGRNVNTTAAAER